MKYLISSIMLSVAFLSVGCGRGGAVDVSDAGEDAVAEFKRMKAEENARYSAPAEAGKGKKK